MGSKARHPHAQAPRPGNKAFGLFIRRMERFMKAINRKTPHHGYRTSSGNRLSFQGRWYVCPGLLSRLQGREFEVYYDRRDVGVLYLFVAGGYIGEAYCPQLMGGRVSEWEARAMRKHDESEAKASHAQGQQVRARMQEAAGSHR